LQMSGAIERPEQQKRCLRPLPQPPCAREAPHHAEERGAKKPPVHVDDKKFELSLQGPKVCAKLYRCSRK
jgi:hypothetical protein